MVYSYQKRKELNEAFMALYPQIEVDYKRDGVPVIHTENLPSVVAPVESLHTLKELIPETAFPWKVVLPVMYKIKKLNEEGEFVDLYEISYANCLPKSMELAESRIDKGNLWMFPDLIRL